MPSQIWSLERGDGPLIAMAIHDGRQVREEVMQYMALDEASRLMEEDPFTGSWTEVAPTRVVGLRSRFEVDLNRPREKAVYRTPEDAWGLEVWKTPLPEEAVQQSLASYDDFYDTLEVLFSQMARFHTRFAVLDLHSYNHRRAGPGAPPADPAENPQVNVGTGTMRDRARWAPLIHRFMDDLASFDFPGGRLDVRENVRFRGGNLAAWTHRVFPDASCVLSVEFKKFFMDEWTGEPNRVLVKAIGRALESTVPGVLEELDRA